MDEITEAYKKWAGKRFYNYPKSFEVNTLWHSHKKAFITGHKFRDEEIKKLIQDCKNHITINETQTKIMDSKNEEIKKLRSELKIKNAEVRRLLEF